MVLLERARQLPTFQKSNSSPSSFQYPHPKSGDMIVCALDSSEQKIEKHYRKHVQLQDLFRTFLHELMTAATHVHDLVLPGTGGQAA